MHRYFVLAVFLVTTSTRLLAEEGTLSLGELVSMALKNSPLASAAEQGVKEKEWTVRQAGAWENPEVAFSLGEKQAGGVHGPTETLGLSQALPLSGRRAFSRKAARFERDAAEAEKKESLSRIVLEVISSASSYATLVEKTALAGKRHERLQIVHTFIRGRSFASPQQRAERDLVEHRFKALEADLLGMEQERDSAWEELLIHTTLDAGSERAVSLPAFPPVAAPELESLAERAILGNPSLTALRFRSEQARTEGRLARREAWPEPVLGGGLSRERALEEERSWEAGLSFTLPFLNRNVSLGRSLDARAEGLGASAELELRRIRAESSKLIKSCRRALTQAEKFPLEGLATLEKSLASAEAAFRTGRLDLLSFLELDAQLTESAFRALDARLDFIQNLAALRYLAGLTEISQ